MSELQVPPPTDLKLHKRSRELEVRFAEVVVAHVRRKLHSAQAEFVYRLLQVSEEMIAAGDYCFWDTLSAAIVTDNSLGTFREMPLRVAEDGPESGRTVPNAGGKAIRVAVSADGAHFKQVLLDTLNGRAR